jgi:uncharacterized membrane protein YgaE (UPF0421/DUF939 family)
MSAYIGLGAAALCLLIFGANSFMIPTMIMIIVLLAAFRRFLEKVEVREQ